MGAQESRESRRRILVVEDNDAMREESVEILQSRSPHAILCDVMMPRVDGFGTLTELKRRRSIEGVPFIFLTAKASPEDVALGRTLGARAYVVKPFTADEVVCTIQGCLAPA